MVQKSYARSERISELIQRTVSQTLLTESRDPRFKMVNITRVQLQSDLKKCYIFVTLFEDEDQKEIIKSLNKAAGYFRQALAKSCELKYTPILQFIYDDTILRASHLHQMIDDI
jgi:ribosome-binding factor A